MSRLNIASAIAQWAEETFSLPITIYVDEIPETESDCACLRYDPAPAAERRFTDGTRLLSWNLTLYTRCKNAQDALFYAQDITEKLDGASVECNEKVTADCEAVTLAQFIDIDAKGYTMYSASIKCTYLEGE